MSLTQSFRERVEAFLVKSGMKPTNLGKEALSDPSFVSNLRNGRVPSLEVADRVDSFMAARLRATSGQSSDDERAA